MDRQIDLGAYTPTFGRRPYWLGLLIAFDQFCNAALWGFVDETLSSRCHRCRDKKRRWAIAERLVNTLFAWDKQVAPDGRVMRHCELAYLGELAREHLPTSF